MKTKHASKQLFIGILAVVAAATEALFGLFLGETIDAIELKQSDLLISLLLSMIALVLVSTATCIWVRVMMYRDASEQVDRLKGDIYSERFAGKRLISLILRVRLIFFFRIIIWGNSLS